MTPVWQQVRRFHPPRIDVRTAEAHFDRPSSAPVHALPQRRCGHAWSCREVLSRFIDVNGSHQAEFCGVSLQRRIIIRHSASGLTFFQALITLGSHRDISGSRSFTPCPHPQVLPISPSAIMDSMDYDAYDALLHHIFKQVRAILNFLLFNPALVSWCAI